MKMYFYRGAVNNFGDELNTWLLPKIFPDFFDDDESRLFLGIGSTIFDFHPAKAEKIVFGTGFGGYTKMPVLDESWKFYAVRGPRTAKACNLDDSKVAADTAVLMNKYRTPNKAKTTKVSFMPHWGSLSRGHWKWACQLAGIRFVDPRWPVEQVVDAIETSEMVIAEAMHFAIVSDALRVPWVPVLPIHPSHWMKWHDWAEPLGIDLKRHKLVPSSLREAYVTARRGGQGEFLENLPGMLGSGKVIADKIFARLAAARLAKLTAVEPNLSSDHRLGLAIEKLSECAVRIKRDYAQIALAA
jgi:succinoglycan biosynthesis protein ExoV